MNTANNSLELFQGILQAAQQMLALTQKPDEEGKWTENLTQLLEKREELIQKINELEAQEDNRRSNLEPQEQAAIKDIIRQIQKTDDDIANKLKDQMHIMREKIGTVRQNKKASSAYLGNEDQAGGWFIDSKK